MAVLSGIHEVCNVVGSSWDKGNMKKFWEDNTPEGVSWPKYCQIKGCGNEAEGGGHMWVKHNTIRFWHILPICKKCNVKKALDDTINESRYAAETKATAHLVPRDHGGSTRLGKMKEGDYLCGQFDVKYSPRTGPSPELSFWRDKSNCKVASLKCHMLDCGKDATKVGRMRVKRLSAFRFLLPICDDCMGCQDLRTGYFPTNKNSKLVAVKKVAKDKAN